jgi:hypothetical protein
VSETVPAFIADAGTPLMWAGFLHLTIGNFFIGLVEAAIVRLCFGVRAGVRLISSIILGNYVSCVAGYILISAFSDRIVAWIGGPLPVYFLGRIMVFLATSSFVVSILIEWPFFWLAMSKRPISMGRSFRATFLANAGSYLGLVVWYWLASAGPNRWGVDLVRAERLAPISNARVFYISPNGNDVMQIELDGSKARKFCSLSSPAPEGILGFSHGPVNNSWELEVQGAWHQPIVSVGGIGPGRATTRPTNDDWFQFEGGDHLDLPTKWSVNAGEWAWEGIQVADLDNGTNFRVMAVEMPWIAWDSCRVSVLPDDQMVFQLGEQIIRVDLKRKLAAAIAAGHGPVVVLGQ